MILPRCLLIFVFPDSAHRAVPPRASITFGLTLLISVCSSTSCWFMSIPCASARVENEALLSLKLGGTSYLQTFVIHVSLRESPASFSSLSSSRPLGPTKGLPAAVSSLDGASPRIISFAPTLPTPGTYLWSVIQEILRYDSFLLIVLTSA